MNNDSTRAQKASQKSDKVEKKSKLKGFDTWTQFRKLLGRLHD